MIPATIIPTKEDGFALIQLNRPSVLNAINMELIRELTDAVAAFEADPDVRCIIITGNEKAFAAGADIKEMADASSIDMFLRDNFSLLDRLRLCKKPIIAAVNGYALGGGCELAMMCDIILASDTAKFGQPEVGIGVIPGWGGTQRLTHAIGKYKAMEMILTGDMINSEEALRLGLAARIVPAASLLDEAKALAKKIASKGPLAVRLAKESILKSLSVPLEEGLEFERKNFFLLFSSDDQKEGMKAFMEKRKPEWKGK